VKLTTTGTYTIVATTTSGSASASTTNLFKVQSSSCNNNGGDNDGWNFTGGSGGNNNGGWGNNGYGNNNNNGWGGYGSYSYNYCTPVPCQVNWQQSWSCNSTQKGGSTLPLCFQIQYTGSSCTNYWNNYFCNSTREDYYNCDDSSRQSWSYYGYWACQSGSVASSSSCLNNHWNTISGCKVSNDSSVKVVCYEIYSNGNTGPAKTYSCSNSASSSTYCINNSDQYQCNFSTSSGTHCYRADVYSIDNSSGNTNFLGTCQFNTR
jgi:hypothetical protein